MSLTPREIQVAQLIAAGLSTKEMAARLHIAPATVKVHAYTLMRKLGVHTRLQVSAALHRWTRAHSHP